MMGGGGGGYGNMSGNGGMNQGMRGMNQGGGMNQPWSGQMGNPQGPHMRQQPQQVINNKYINIETKNCESNKPKMSFNNKYNLNPLLDGARIKEVNPKPLTLKRELQIRQTVRRGALAVRV